VHWPNTLPDWEWAIGEGVVLPLLFWELYRLRRTQRRDREAARDAEKPPADKGAG
jgi:signal transduction histidine kinase